MREFDALKRYPQPNQPRYVGPSLRTVHSRIIAAYRGEEYYDGDDLYGSYCMR